MKWNWRNALVIGAAIVAAAGAGAWLIAGQVADQSPSFVERGGFISVIEVEADAASEPLVQELIHTLRNRIDPRGRYGVEFAARGATIEVRVPSDDDLVSLREELARQQERLASHGVPVDRLAMVALRADLSDADGAREAEEHINAIAREHAVTPDDIRSFIRIAHEIGERAHWTSNPADLSVALSAMGVLEFRIAANPSGFATPTPGGVATPPEGHVWRPVRQLADWLPPGPERDALLAQLPDDPADYFARSGLVARQHEGRVYLLLGGTPQTSLTRGGGWRITSVSRFRDEWTGRQALRFHLDEQGGRLMQAMTGAHVGRGLAITVDHEVIGAPRLMDAIGAEGVIHGNFTERELRLLELALRHPLPVPIRVTETRISSPSSPPKQAGSP